MPVQPRNSELFKLAAAGEYAKIADMSYADIARFHEQQRFKAIAEIKKIVLAKDPAPKDDPKRPVCAERFANEISSMVKISMTMRHSKAYSKWLEECRNLLFTRLVNNSHFMRFLPQWNGGDLSIKKALHTIREKEHTQAANDTFEAIFSCTKINFFKKSKQQDSNPNKRTILHGYAASNIKTNKRIIGINYHEDSKFKNAHSSLGNGHHEKFHDLGTQIGYYYGQGKLSVLGNKTYDAMLCYYLERERAIIPARISKNAYRKQFHEVAAFDEGDKMEEMIKQILAGNLTPPVPSCNQVRQRNYRALAR